MHFSPLKRTKLLSRMCPGPMYGIHRSPLQNVPVGKRFPRWSTSFRTWWCPSPCSFVKRIRTQLAHFTAIGAAVSPSTFSLLHVPWSQVKPSSQSDPRGVHDGNSQWAPCNSHARSCVRPCTAFNRCTWKYQILIASLSLTSDYVTRNSSSDYLKVIEGYLHFRLSKTF